MSAIDWGTGEYERISPEFGPVADAVVRRAAVRAGQDVVDIACGDGNAALRAAAAGARVIGVDRAPRLVRAARERAAAQGLTDAEFRTGDLMALGLPDACADTAVSVFGIIFAPDPGGALAEAGRILRPGGRLVLSAWVPDGPVFEALRASGAVLARATGRRPEPPFAWFDATALAPIASDAGLELVASTRESLAVRAASAEAYAADGERFHPMALAAAPALERAGLAAEAHSAMVDALRAGNEDPDGLLMHNPWVAHELRKPG